MASTAMKLHLLLLLSSLALHARAEIGGSVVFFDASNHKFIRGNSMAIKGEGKTLSANEVTAIISVLLGSAPVSLSADSSLKLNEVLFPNPFDRPYAVFMLEVTGIKDPLSAFSYSNNKVGSAYSSGVLGSSKADLELSDPLSAFSYSNNKVGSAYSSGVLGSSKADLELSGEQEVSHLDESLDIECDAACIRQELAYLGGTYAGTSESMDGELSFHLADGSSLNLHLAKKADQSFALSLVSLTRHIKKAVENREVLAESIISPAELLLGRFTGIEALEEEYGSGDIVHQGIELLQTAITKSFELLQKSYGGKIVGVVLANRESSVNSGSMLNVMFSAHEPRWLAEVSPFDETIAEVILVRLTLAWITGIILLVSALLGIYYLLYMPLTRDTLLYSNVKFD